LKYTIGGIGSPTSDLCYYYRSAGRLQ